MNPYKFRFLMYLAILILIMALAPWGFMLVEEFSAVDAVYFTIVTIATVGYGDVHPVTPEGKFLAIVLITMGVSTFLGVIANATEMMLTRREQKTRLEKLNMVIGLFFSEVGTELLRYFSDCDPRLEDFRKDLVVTAGWTGADFSRVHKRLSGYTYAVNISLVALEDLRSFLRSRNDLLLRMLENPALLEHGAFTDLLRAVFHLAEELSFRPVLSGVPETDLAHLAADIRRAYTLLVSQWLDYMLHLKKNYPYLFSLAMRTNPFDEKASVIVS